MRCGIRRVIEKTADFCVKGEAADVAALHDGVREAVPDVLVLDTAMADASPVDLVRQLRQGHPQLPILVVSMQTQSRVVSRILEAGVAGYVTKDCPAEMFLNALRRVLQGGHFIDPSLAESVVFAARGAKSAPDEQLSPREMQVLELIASGVPLGEIAGRLGLSPKTVSTHKTRLMQKLGVATNADLLKYAVRNGLTSA